jgi:ABC-type transport system involved in multi-copper enzyme maturation permease subunit
MNALVWRLHRNQAYIAGAGLVALTVVLLVTGILISGDYHLFLSSCSSTNSCSDTSQLFSQYGLVNNLVFATMAVPLLLGLFWGAPLLAKEFEDGTHSLAWTQGVTRRRWLVTTMAWPLLLAALWGGAMAALVSWWRIPMNALGMPSYRLSPSLFDVQGAVPVAYSVFAVALGIAAGAIWRRVLPAMGTTVALFVAVRLVVADYLRPHYLAPVTKTVSITAGAVVPHAGWAQWADLRRRA